MFQKRLMKRTARKRLPVWAVWICFAGLLLPMLVAGVWLARQMHQDELDRSLIAAVKRHDAPGVESLLKRGANANACDSGQPPKNLVESLHRLLSRFRFGNVSNPRPADNSNVTALMLVLKESDNHSAPYINPEPDNDAIAVSLIRHGAVTRPPKGCTWHPLYCAVRDNLHETIRELLQRGAVVNPRDDPDHNPLFEANAEGTVLLLQYGADPNVTDSYGSTPLFYAVSELSGESSSVAGLSVNAAGTGLFRQAALKKERVAERDCLR